MVKFLLPVAADGLPGPGRCRSRLRPRLAAGPAAPSPSQSLCSAGPESPVTVSPGPGPGAGVPVPATRPGTGTATVTVTARGRPPRQPRLTGSRGHRLGCKLSKRQRHRDCSSCGCQWMNLNLKPEGRLPGSASESESLEGRRRQNQWRPLEARKIKSESV